MKLEEAFSKYPNDTKMVRGYYLHSLPKKEIVTYEIGYLKVLYDWANDRKNNNFMSPLYDCDMQAEDWEIVE